MLALTVPWYQFSWFLNANSLFSIEWEIKTFHSDIKSRIVSMLDSSSPDREAEHLHRSLVLLATWRGVLIKNTILAKDGMMVQKGPFAGLGFLSDSAEGCHIPKLLGCYEQPLQPMIEEVIAKPYDTLLNIGC